jgi:hypothetical protein
MIGNMLTEEKVKEFLSQDLPKGEVLEFVGHGFSHLLGFTYYIGRSKGIGVTAQLFNGCHIHEPITMPLEVFKDFASKKRVEIFPFDVPPLQYEKNREIYHILKDTIEKHLELDEDLVTLCRASRYGLKNYLIGITDRRLLLFTIKPKKRLEVTGLESFPLSGVEEITIPYGPFGAESLPIRVPLIDQATTILVKLSNRKAVKYRITDVRGSIISSASGGS